MEGSPPETDAAAPKSTGPQLLSDPVPLLRTDLIVSPNPEKPGLFEVGRRGDEKAFTLYDFEVSIARMLNGKRSVSELIESASRIGIPVTLDSFQKFVRQMRAYGFLDGGEAAPQAEPDDPSSRAEWTPEARAHFQSALRTFRLNRFAEARGYLEALQQIQPNVSEAVELLARIEAREREEPGSAAPPPAEPSLPVAPEPLLPTEQGTTGGTGSPARSPKRVAALAALPALLAILVVAAIPVAPCRVSSAVEVAPGGARVAVVARAEGQLAYVLEGDAPWAEPGVNLAQLDEQPVKDRLLAIDRELSTLEKRIEAAHRRRSSRTRSAQATVARKEREVLKLQASVAKLEGKATSSRARRLLASARRKLARAEAALERARRSAGAADGTKVIAQLTAAAAALKSERAELQATLELLSVPAPSAGAFVAAKRKGDSVRQGDELGALVDDRVLHVRIAVAGSDASRLAKGQRALIRFEGRTEPVETTLSKVSKAGSGFWSAEASLDNAARRLPSRGMGLAEIECGSRSLASLMFGSR